MSLRNLTIFRALLFAIAGTGLLVALVSGIAHYVHSSQLIEASVRQQMRSALAGAISEFERGYTVPVRTDLRRLESSAELDALLISLGDEAYLPRAASERLLLAVVKSNPDVYSAIRVFDATGAQRAAVEGRDRVRGRESIRERAANDAAGAVAADLFNILRAGEPGQVRFDGPARRADGRLVLLTGIAMREPEIGGFGGAVIVELDLLPYLRYLSQLRIFERAPAWLLDPGGRVLLAPTAPADRFDPTPYVIGGEPTPAGALVLGSDASGARELLGLFTVTLSMSPDTLVSQVRGAGWIALAVLLAVALSATGIALVVARQLGSPISALSRMTREVIDGDMNARVPEVWGGELGRLARAFNEMVRSLQRTTVSTDYMNDIFESMTDTLVVTDHQGRIRTVNRALCELLGHTEEELVGRPMRVILGHESSFDPTETSREPGEALWQGETIYVTCDGRAIPVSLSSAVMRERSGEVRGFVCVAQDVTERRRAREELERRESLFKTIVNNVPDAIVITDVDHAITLCNPGFERTFGYRQREVVGRRTDALFASDDERARFERERFNLVSERQYSPIEGRFRRKDGEEFTAEAFGTVIRDDEGRPLGYLGVMRDVTERRRAERELVRAKEQSEAAARSKSEFLANMSHEIRTPMNGVLGMTDLLLGTRLDGEQRGFADTIRSSAEALLTIIDDILDFSRMEAGKLRLEPAPFDLARTVDEVAGLLAPRAAAKGVELRGEVADAPLGVVGDGGRVRQILMNLVANAIKFTAAGHVTVRVARTGPERGARIEVEDTGIGIPEDKIASIFDKFSQADASTTRKYGGAGLGLAICSQLAELMGGRVGATSRVGEGSTFWVELPLPAVELAGAAPAPAPAHEAPLPRRARVLVAEDNPVNQKVAELVLRKLGCEVDVAETGRAALDLIEREGYDLVLMDCQMPEMDGYEATRELRRREGGGPRLPVVAMTANAMAGDRERCLAAGMDDYVSKPTTVAAIRGVLERWLEPVAEAS